MNKYTKQLLNHKEYTMSEIANYFLYRNAEGETSLSANSIDDLNLDDLFADEKYGLGGTELAYDGPAREEVIPQFLNECSIDGHYYAVPYMRSTEACYVNKTYVENLGYTLPDVLTWDFIWEVSEAATVQNADGTYVVNGQNVLIPFIYKSTDNMMIQMLKQKHAGYSDENGNIIRMLCGVSMVSSVIISERAVRGVLKTLPVYHKTVSARTEKHHIAPNGAKNPGYLGAGIAFQD